MREKEKLWFDLSVLPVRISRSGPEEYHSTVYANSIDQFFKNGRSDFFCNLRHHVTTQKSSKFEKKVHQRYAKMAKMNETYKFGNLVLTYSNSSGTLANR